MPDSAAGPERLTCACPECGRRVRIRATRGGDGTAFRPTWHKDNATGQPCRGRFWTSAATAQRRVTRKGAPGSVYVGRPTFLGNPFVIGRDGDRAEVIAKYAAWFAKQVADPAFAERVRTYCGDYDLACWCAPQACHADVIVRWLDA